MSIEATNPLRTHPYDPGEASSERRGLSVAGESAKGQHAPRSSVEDASLVEERDRISLSPEARALADRAEPSATAERSDPNAPREGEPTDHAGELSEDHAGELSEQDQQLVEQLQARDREVRAHEGAHLAAAGPHAQGGAHYDYQTGPDGRRYAVGGHVNIDISAVAGDPQATITKSEQVRRAALAPAEPSSKDRQVAARASAEIARARAELRSDGGESEELTASPAQESDQTAPSDQARRGSRHPKATRYGDPASTLDPAGQLIDLSA